MPAPAVVDQAVGIYRDIGRDVRGLMKVSAVWFVLQLAANIGFAPLIANARPEDMAAGQFGISMLFLLLSLLTFYAVHVYWHQPGQTASWLPRLSPRPLLHYVLWQAAVIMGTGILGMLIALPLQILWGVFNTIPDAEGKPMLAALPFYIELLPPFFMLVMYSRMVLVGPLVLRNVEMPFRLSQRYTSGSTWRVAMVQMLLIIPLLLPIILWSRLGRYEINVWELAALAAFYSAGMIVFTWVYVALAEREYKRQVK